MLRVKVTSFFGAGVLGIVTFFGAWGVADVLEQLSAGVAAFAAVGSAVKAVHSDSADKRAVSFFISVFPFLWITQNGAGVL